MSHCIDHLRKWKRDGNFCGLGKQYASEIDEWVSLIDKITKNGAGIDEGFAVEHFTAGAARPLIRCRDQSIKTKTLNYVISCLKRGETITGGDLDATIKGFQGKPVKKGAEIPSVPLEPPTESLTIVKTETTPDTDVKPTDAPPVTAADLLRKEQYGGTDQQHDPPPSPEPAVRAEEMVRAGENHPSPFHTAAEELAAKRAGIAGEMYPAGNSTELSKSSPVWTPVVCKTGPCPDGKTHSSFDKVRGVCCDLTGQPVNQISACAYLERQKKMAAAASSAACTITGGTIRHEMPPLVARRNSLGEIVFHPSPKQEEFIARVMRLEDLKTAEDAISTIVDQAMEMQDV